MNHVTACLMGTVMGAVLVWILAPYVWEPDVAQFGRAVIQGYVVVTLPGAIGLICINYMYRTQRIDQ